jgi:hypothetical protein
LSSINVFQRGSQTGWWQPDATVEGRNAEPILYINPVLSASENWLSAAFPARVCCTFPGLEFIEFAGAAAGLQDTGHYSIRRFFSISVLVRRTKSQ